MQNHAEIAQEFREIYNRLQIHKEEQYEYISCNYEYDFGFTQIIRVTQNAISLNRQNKLIKEQLREIGEVGDEDIKNRREVDRLAIRYLKIKLDENDDLK